MKLDKCSICGVERMDQSNNPKWKSDLCIIFIGKSKWEKRFTICPDCRCLPLNNIFDKVKGLWAKTIPKFYLNFHVRKNHKSESSLN